MDAGLIGIANQTVYVELSKDYNNHSNNNNNYEHYKINKSS